MSEKQLNFLFWNLNGKNLAVEISELVQSNEISIFITAECQHPAEILRHLNQESVLFRLQNFDKIMIFSKFDENQLVLRHEDERFFIHELRVNNEQLFLVSLHLTSKLFWNNEEQYIDTQYTMDMIKRVAGEYSKIIIVGDFNMNPFEIGMVESRGFHALSDRQIVKRKSRIVNNQEYGMFYNPMWNFLGDENKAKVSGSYFYNKSSHINYFWNIFDQVIVSESLVEQFNMDFLNILTFVNGKSLLSPNHAINSNNFSDHLPIKFQITL